MLTVNSAGVSPIRDGYENNNNNSNERSNLSIAGFLPTTCETFLMYLTRLLFTHDPLPHLHFYT